MSVGGVQRNRLSSKQCQVLRCKRQRERLDLQRLFIGDPLILPEDGPAALVKEQERPVTVYQKGLQRQPKTCQGILEIPVIGRIGRAAGGQDLGTLNQVMLGKASGTVQPEHRFSQTLLQVILDGSPGAEIKNSRSPAMI